MSEKNKHGIRRDAFTSVDVRIKLLGRYTLSDAEHLVRPTERAEMDATAETRRVSSSRIHLYIFRSFIRVYVRMRVCQCAFMPDTVHLLVKANSSAWTFPRLSRVSSLTMHLCTCSRRVLFLPLLPEHKIYPQVYMHGKLPGYVEKARIYSAP